MSGRIRVQVVLALPGGAEFAELDLPAGSTLREAVSASAIPSRHPSLPLDAGTAGIFGARVPADYVLKDGDRVELYRPLAADPKAARRARARKSGQRS